MELLVPALVVIITEIVKKLGLKLDKELFKSISLFVAFFFSFVGVLMLKLNVVGYENVNMELVIQVLATSVGYYEIAVKRFILPVVDKLFNTTTP